MLNSLRRWNRLEKRILAVAKKAGSFARVRQYGFSRRSDEGFRLPIYVMEIGRQEACRERPVGFVAGVHGLETIAIRILLDFLEHAGSPSSPGFMKEIRKGEIGIIALPVLNPGGYARRTRSNPVGVDLMRNSGLEAHDAMPFFGGQSLSRSLPYYRGQTREPETRTLFKCMSEYFFHTTRSIAPVLDIHSGYGTRDSFWWPYAGFRQITPDEDIFARVVRHLRSCGHTSPAYSQQSESYTTHGDLWDRLYIDHIERVRSADSDAAPFLPMTLEIGTWSGLKRNPFRLFSKKGIFSPHPREKEETIVRYRGLLADFAKLVLTIN